jgi:hypothetical protein
MKKKIKKSEIEEIRPVNDQPGDEELNDEFNKDLSIEEFMKIRKLQNQILEKMLKKLDHPDRKK